MQRVRRAVVGDEPMARAMLDDVVIAEIKDHIAFWKGVTVQR